MQHGITPNLKSTKVCCKPPGSPSRHALGQTASPGRVTFDVEPDGDRAHGRVVGLADVDAGVLAPHLRYVQAPHAVTAAHLQMGGVCSEYQLIGNLKCY